MAALVVAGMQEEWKALLLSNSLRKSHKFLSEHTLSMS